MKIKQIISITSLILVICAVMPLSGCFSASQDPIIGRWATQNGSVILTFSNGNFSSTGVVNVAISGLTQLSYTGSWTKSGSTYLIWYGDQQGEGSIVNGELNVQYRGFFNNNVSYLEKYIKS